MDIVTESVKKISDLLSESGCEAGSVQLDVDDRIVPCQYDRGTCMTASFGGKSAEFITSDPVRAQTRISFMFGSVLDTPRTRSAACSILNVVAGFFCVSRVLHSCAESSHGACRRQLEQKIGGRKVYCIGSVSHIGDVIRSNTVTDPAVADIILINGEGIITEGAGTVIRDCLATKEIICLGPSPAGVARLNQIGLWCPYGTG